MAAADIYVSFGADTGGLEAATALAKASVQAMTRELNSLAREMAKTGAAADSDLADKMRAAGAAVAASKAEYAALGGQLAGLAGGMQHAGAGAGAAGREMAAAGAHGRSAAGEMSFFTNELRALADEATSGRWRNFDGSLMRVAGHSAGMIAEFVKANPALTAMGAAAALAAAALGGVAIKSDQAYNSMKALELDATVSQFKLSAAAAADLRDRIEELANVGPAAAEGIAKPFLALGSGGDVVAKMVAQYIPMLAKQMGEDAPKAAEKLAENFADLSSKGQQFMERTVGMTAAQIKQFAAFRESGDVVHAYGVIIGAMHDRLEEARSGTQLQNAALSDAKIAALGASDGVAALGTQEGHVGTVLAAATADMEAQKSMLVGLKADLLDAAAAADHMQQSMANATRTALQFDKPAAEIQKLTGDIAGLTAGLAAARVAGDRTAIDQFSNSLRNAQDELKKAQERGADPILGRDALQQVQAANEALANTHKGSEVDLLTQQRAALQQLAGDETKSASERAAAAADAAAKTKAITVAEFADFQAAEEVKVRAAGKASAAVIAIREAEAAKARDMFGAGSNEERAAIEAVARAKEQAATRGGAAAAKAAKEALAGTQEGYAKEIAEAEKAAQGKIKLYELEYKAKQITEAQKLALTLAALNEEKGAVDKAYAAEIALAGNTAKTLEELQGQLRIFNLENANAMADAQEQAAIKTTQAWDSAEKSINSAFTGQIKGLLDGTETWRKAATNVLEDLTVKTIEWGVNTALIAAENAAKNIALGNAVTAAHVAGDAQMAAADQSAGAAGALSWIGSALHSIEASAAEAFAGVFGFLAPILGPAAAGPAAGAEATVLAAAGGIGHMATGTWDPPHDMLSVIHRGEMVVPASFASGLRDAIGGGGDSGGGGRPVHVHPTTVFNVNANDSASVAQWARNNGSELAKAMEQAARHGVFLGMRRLGG